MKGHFNYKVGWIVFWKALFRGDFGTTRRILRKAAGG